MAKRGGKAASRRSRQRPVRRPAPPPRAAASAEGAPGAQSASAAAAARPTPSGEVATPATRDTRGERRAPAPDLPYRSSILSERAQAEYHYVAKDLRNIGVLTAVIGLLLALAFVLFRVVGLGA